ncbi:MAG: STAS-like domain-containing protein [Armatimonadetes bacterium]|nr:STAS-like domain-containing protein [Armatimonadota bacterium]
MKTIKIQPDTGVFVENKEEAQRIRKTHIMPALKSREQVVLDFSEVQYATQSFVHTLISEGLKRHGEESLEYIEFKNCSPALQSVIEWVVDYSLGGFGSTEVANPEEGTKKEVAA